jgi:hypothetical protein
MMLSCTVTVPEPLGGSSAVQSYSIQLHSSYGYTLWEPTKQFYCNYQFSGYQSSSQSPLGRAWLTSSV